MPWATSANALEAMADDTCSICGGEGRIAGPWGRTTVCPGCHGSGRQAELEPLLRDVTKTKPSHYRATSGKPTVEKQTWPSTHDGAILAAEVRDSRHCDEELKPRLIREIIEYEGSHGHLTKTFSRKIRKQIRPPG